MLITPYYSSKIKVLNTVLIVMVLFIHSYYIEGEKYHLALAVQRFVSGSAFCGVANKLFFVFSGLLFFNGVNHIKDCLPKIKKRARTILIPYLIWNCIFVCWYLILKIIPGVGSFVNSDISNSFKNLWDGLYFLWITPASFPLWFLRDLICLVLISPLIYLFIKYFRFLGILVYFIYGLFYPAYGIWFILGGGISLCYDLERLKKLLSTPIVIISSIVFILGCGYICIQPINYIPPRTFDSVMAVTGLIMVWRLYDYLAKGRILDGNKFPSSIVGYSFFIYLFHEPVFNIIKKLPIRILGDTEEIVIFFFLFNPFLMCVVSIVVAKIMQKIIPGIYSVLVGGR